MRWGAEVPAADDLHVLGAVHRIAVPDATLRQDVHDAFDVLRLVLRPVLERVAAEVNQQVNFDALFLRRQRDVAYHVGAETETNQYEPRVAILLPKVAHKRFKLAPVI